MALLWCDDEQASPIERAGLRDSHARPKAHIVVVDADDSGRALVSGVLMNAGYRVTGLHDGEMLFPLLREHEVDLLILEADLPGMDGFALCQTIRAVSDVPIIFLSARAEAADRVAGLECGATKYLVKPIEPTELQACVAAALGRGNRRRGMGDQVRIRTLAAISLHHVCIKLEREAAHRSIGLTTNGYVFLTEAGRA
jgi:DNA-binding response OmpR family regulator